MDETTLTPKAERTRQHILDTALRLFAERGYDATTLRDIAEAADCSLGLAYRYFASKEAFVHALYQRMAAATAEHIAALPRESIADRFYSVMRTRLEQATVYREALGALFGATMNPSSGVSILGAESTAAREQARQSFVQLVQEASDAPNAAARVEALGTLLYSLHFALILFWLYDRQPEQAATADLLAFTRETMARLRPALGLPLVAHSLARLARIVEGVFVA